MTRIISKDDMSTVQRSLAEAGIYFDKLYIKQVGEETRFILIDCFCKISGLF